jgi:cell division protease FtsH
VISQRERQITAYHEAGHALVASVLPEATRPHKISIISQGRMGGYMWSVDEEEHQTHTRSALIDRMATILAGRAAEQLVFGQPGSGAADDLAKVNDLARWMVCELGMAEALADLTYPNGHTTSRYSEEEARLIGSEVRRLVEEARNRARTVLTDQRDALDHIAAALLEHETLSATDLQALIGRTAPVAV